MSTIQVVLFLPCFMVFLFFFWRRLKEDMRAEFLFGGGLLLGGLGLLALVASIILESSYWFWMVNVGFFGGMLLAVWKYRMRFFESLEAFVVGTFAFWTGWFWFSAPIGGRWVGVVQGTFFLVLICLFFVFDRRYKAFSWYRSGKIGFSGLSVLGVFFVARAVVAVVSPNMLSFVGRFEAIVSGLLAFLVFFLLYNLAQEKT